MVNYHPHDDLLMSFAAGQLSNTLGLMISCHLEHCPDCRQKVRQYEALGGALLENAPSKQAHDTDLPNGSHSASPGMLDSLLSKIDLEGEIVVKQTTTDDTSRDIVVGNIEIPRPLRRFVDSNLVDIPWKGMSRNIKEYDLTIEDTEYTAKFYKISAGRVLPEHTHTGNEYTLVLSGSFSDRTCHYKKGDFILADEQTVHQPRASEDGDCICFAVMDAPLKMTGFFGRMLNPFLK